MIGNQHELHRQPMVLGGHRGGRIDRHLVNAEDHSLANTYLSLERLVKS